MADEEEIEGEEFAGEDAGNLGVCISWLFFILVC